MPARASLPPALPLPLRVLPFFLFAHVLQLEDSWWDRLAMSWRANEGRLELDSDLCQPFLIHTGRCRRLVEAGAASAEYRGSRLCPLHPCSRLGNPSFLVSKPLCLGFLSFCHHMLERRIRRGVCMRFKVPFERFVLVLYIHGLQLVHALGIRDRGFVEVRTAPSWRQGSRPKFRWGVIQPGRFHPWLHSGMQWEHVLPFGWLLVQVFVWNLAARP